MHQYLQTTQQVVYLCIWNHQYFDNTHFDAGKRKRKVEEEAERRRREERAEEERRVQERIILIFKTIINVKSFIIDIHSRRFWML